jgi:hypothetical protein
MSLRFAAALLALWSNACGSSPASPTPPATLEYFTVSPHLETILVGRPQQLTANGIFSDGQARTVAATWRTDNPQAATVNEQGLVTPLRPGPVTIMATFGDKSAAVSVKVVQDFSGQWEGPGVILSCAALLAGSCATPLSLPAVRLSLFVDQIGQRVRTLVVVLYQSANNHQLWTDGAVSDAGELRLAGEQRTDFGPRMYRVRKISDWLSVIAADGTMTGGTQAWREENLSFDATQRLDIRFDALVRERAGPASR